MAHRIVFLYHSMAAHGGMERIWAEKMNWLAQHSDYEVFFITSDQGTHPYSYPLAQQIHHIDLGGVPFHSIYRYSYPLRLWQVWRYRRDYTRRLRHALKEIHPDIITTTNDHNISLIAGWKTDAKKVIEFHLAKEFSLKRKPGHRENPLSRLWKTIYDRRTTSCLRQYDVMTVLTHTDQRQWADVRKTVVIPNSSRLAQTTNCKLQTANSRIIAVGRLYPQKGFDLLLQAWVQIAARHPKWHLDIYGDGGEKGALLQQAQDLGISQSFTIHPATDNIFDEYRKSDFLVLSSRYEGFGLVLVESMSCGIPVVSFDCPNGPADIVKDGHNGLLVPNGDITALAAAMERLIDNPAEREAMGRQAAIDAQAYSIENIGRRWIKLYSQLLTPNS